MIKHNYHQYVIARVRYTFTYFSVSQLLFPLYICLFIQDFSETLLY